MTKIDLNFLHSELKRVCDWVQFADKKVAFLSAYYSAVIGFCVASKDQWVKDLQSLEPADFWTQVGLAAVAFVCIAAGMIFLVFAIFPRTKNGFTNNSLFYFGNVNKMKIVDFQNSYKKLTVAQAKDQLTEQIYSNCKIVSRKMSCIKISTGFLIASVALVIVLFLI